MQTLTSVIDDLDEAGDRPAIVRLHADGVEQISYRDLHELVARHAAGVTQQGVDAGEAVAIFAAAGSEWIVACLALIRAGAVPVPLDTQLDEESLERILTDCEARCVLCQPELAERLESIDYGGRIVLLGGGGGTDEEGEGEESWRHWAVPEHDALPDAEPDDRALLFYTSGTTGAPKGVPLAHRHLAYQIDVMREADLVGEDDRLLLPLPLHHVYPLVAGTLVPLALRLPIILPQSLTGPQLVRALREGEATVIVGVPRIYEALLQGLEQRIAARGAVLGGVLRLAIALTTALRRRTGLDLGGVLLRRVRERIGPRLRMLVSGGSAISPEVAWKLEGLGWRVASGYGLTETAPLLSVNPPGSRVLDSAGKPVRDVEIRIDRAAHPEDGEGGDGGGREGEILARGPGVFDGYLDLEEKTRGAFTGDGWFRTGDLGWMDEDGYLYVTGRKSTLIVTPSGENIRTERLEETYAQHELIEEIGILEADGGLAAVVVPARAEISRRDLEVGDAVRRALDDQGGQLPSHQRVARFVSSRAPLERTRLGKLRRHRLRERYDELREGGDEPERRSPVPIAEMSGADRELLADDRARRTWELMARRFSDHGLEPDSRFDLDLGLDSLGWLDLSLEIAERTGIELDEEEIAGIETVRDLLTAVAEGSPEEEPLTAEPLTEPEAFLDDDQRRWLEPLHPAAAWLARLLSLVNRLLVRSAFRLEVRGRGHLPEKGPVVLAPNHTSYLDPFVVAAALPEGIRERTFWGGWTGAAFRNAVLRAGSRLARAVPVDPERAVISSLAFAGAALERGGSLVWFPEGRRSPSGELQDFRPGIGMLLERFEDLPVIPVSIEGAHAAWPTGRRLPRPGRVRVRFGREQSAASLAEEGRGEERRERIADGLRRRVEELLGGS